MTGRMSDSDKAKKVLSAVERIIAKDQSIFELVAQAKTKVIAAASEKLSPGDVRELAAAELVRVVSNRAAIAGGASSLPSLIPGAGVLVGLGGGLAELVLLLKWEVELVLALQHLYGFDITDPRERQLAFLLASVGTYDATGKNFFVEVAKVPLTAVWNYAPRKLARFVVQALTVLLAVYVWRGFIKMIPVVGVVASTGLNKVFTRRVGNRCWKDLRTRRELLAEEKAAEVKAKKPAARARPAARRRARPAEAAEID